MTTSMPQISLATLGLLPLLILALWVYTSHMTTKFPTLSGKRILLLIAHPDDEAMFFAPTLLALTKPHLQNHVKILCLSSGNAAGLGETRKKELLKSGLILGLRSNQDVLVVEDEENFQDSMSKTWDKEKIASLLEGAFAPKMKTLKKTDPPQTNIDVLITFDSSGISSHPNHKSLHAGALHFIRSLSTPDRVGWSPPITLYTLTTVSFLRKYLSVLDAPLSVLRVIGVWKRERGEYPNPLFFVGGMGDYWRAREAMVNAHVSQMVWFRWGWITVSRYMYINDLRKEV